MRRAFSLFVGFALVQVACVSGGGTATAPEQDQSSRGFELRFDPDPHQAPAALVRAGDTANVSFAEQRLANCGPGSSLELFYKTAEDETHHRVPLGSEVCARVTGPCAFPFNDVSASFQVPNTVGLELWFHAQNGACEQWDSRGAANYAFDVLRRETEVITFRHGASPTLSGPLLRRTTFTLDYDFSRIQLCDRGGEEGSRSLQLDYRFDDGAVQKSSTGNIVFGGRFGEIVVPDHAEHLTIWFVSPSVGSCGPFYDSNDGKNFVFPISG